MCAARATPTALPTGRRMEGPIRTAQHDHGSQQVFSHHRVPIQSLNLFAAMRGSPLRRSEFASVVQGFVMVALSPGRVQAVLTLRHGRCSSLYAKVPSLVRALECKWVGLSRRLSIQSSRSSHGALLTMSPAIRSSSGWGGKLARVPRENIDLGATDSMVSIQECGLSNWA